MSDTTKSPVNPNYQIPRKKKKTKGVCKIGSIGIFLDLGFFYETRKDKVEWR